MLMIKPIVCHNCKKQVVDLPFELCWKYESNKCDHCFNVHKSYHKYEFCSSKCLKEFGDKFHNHKHQWDISFIGSGATINKDKIVDVMAFCKICKETNYHCKDKKVVAKYKRLHKKAFGTIE